MSIVNMTIILKFEYEGKSRRTTLVLASTTKSIFGRLCASCRLLFTRLSLKLFDFEYIDEDSDCITMSSDQEALEALSMLSKTGGVSLKLRVVNVRTCSEYHHESHMILDKMIFRDYLELNEGMKTPEMIRGDIVTTSTSLASLRAECIGYRVIPSDSPRIHPGCKSMHVWTVKNTGNVTWPSVVVLSIPSHFGLVTSLSDLQQQLPSLAAGDQTDVALEIVAPCMVGQYSILGSIIAECQDAPPIVMCCNLPVFLSVEQCSGSEYVGREEKGRCVESLELLFVETEKCAEDGAVAASSGDDHEGWCGEESKQSEGHEGRRARGDSTPAGSDSEEEEEGGVFEDFPLLLLDASTGRVSSCSVTGSMVFVGEEYEEATSPRQNQDDKADTTATSSSCCDLEEARALYQQRVVTEAKNDFWDQEISVVRTMGFQLHDDELVQLLVDHAPSNGHYNEEEIQEFIMLLLAHTSS
jgi:hypothetical protein